MTKTLTFAAMHITIAFAIVYLMTGDVVVVGLSHSSSRSAIRSGISFTSDCGSDGEARARWFSTRLVARSG